MKFLKRTIFFMLLLITISFGSIIKCDAANANVSLSSSTNRAVVGNTITYTVKVSSSSPLGAIVYSLNYDSSKLTIVSGTLNDTFTINNDNTKSATFTFKFKAKASGTANVSFVLNEALDFDGNPFTVNKTTSKSITIITQAQLEDSYSKNNYLSSLGVDGYTIEFDKNTLEYALTVENDVKSVNITGSKEDSTASVTGLGIHDVVEGLNKINIVVTAQNGSTKTYGLNITVKELSPIVVEVDEKTFNVVRKKELITAPNSKYVETIIKINEEDVPAFINETTNVILVGLKDEEGNIELYSYGNDSYSLYREFSSNKIIITEEKFSNVPAGYFETKITLNEKEITAYQNDSSSHYYLIYATNIENGLTNIYQFDSKENTIQLFDKDEFDKKESLKEKNKIYEYIIIGMGILLAGTYIGILVSTIKRSKKKEKNKTKEIKLLEKTDDFTEKFDNIENSVIEKKQIIEKDDKIEETISKKKQEKVVKKKKK